MSRLRISRPPISSRSVRSRFSISRRVMSNIRLASSLNRTGSRVRATKVVGIRAVAMTAESAKRRNNCRRDMPTTGASRVTHKLTTKV